MPPPALRHHLTVLLAHLDRLTPGRLCAVLPLLLAVVAAVVVAAAALLAAVLVTAACGAVVLAARRGIHAASTP